MKKLIYGLLGMAAFTTVSADGYWLNMAGQPSMSLATQTQESCQASLIEYVKTERVHYISCDVKPLPDAVNVRPL